VSAHQFLVTDNVVVNLGDAAILLAMQESLRAEFGPETIMRACFCAVTREAGAFADRYPELTFVPTLWHVVADGAAPRSVWSSAWRQSARWRFPSQARLAARRLPNLLLHPAELDLLRLYRDADAVLVTGGGLLGSSWTGAGHRHLRIAQYEAALALGKPLVFYAASYGPFRPGDPLPQLLRPVMERAAAVISRDSISTHVLRDQIGLRGANVHETIDEAVLLEPRTPRADLAPPRTRALRFGLAPHRWPWGGVADRAERQRAFEQQMAVVARSLLERYDADVILCTSHPRLPDTLHLEEDVPERIVDMLPQELQERAHPVGGFVHPAEYAAIMGGCDVVISSRLHGAILALAGGAPVIALAYEHKTPGFYEKAGLRDWALSMGDSSPEEILAVADTILSDGLAARERVREAVARARSIARQNRQIVARALAGR